MNLVRRIAAWLIRVLIVLLCGGLLLRATIGDSVPLLATVFYATPPIMLCLLALGVSLLSALLHQRFMAAGLAILGAALFGWHVQSSYYPGSPPPGPRSEQAIRLLLWNVCSDLDNGGSIEQWIRRWNPDVACLLEARTYDRPVRFWHERFADYQVRFLVSEMVLLARGDITLVENRNLSYQSYASRIELRSRGQSFELFMVDVVGNPLVPRKEALQRMMQMLPDEIDRKPILILGDFNTPRSSVFFRELRRQFEHAFETRGRGFAETWPLPLPVLDLDHVWSSSPVEVWSCRQPYVLASDHRPVIVEFEVRDGSP